MTTMDYNAINNSASLALLKTDRLDEVLSDLGVDIRSRYGNNRRGPCPIHLGDSTSFSLWSASYDKVPIRWRCFSEKCHETFKPSLLGLVRGVLSTEKGRMVRMREAVDFLARYVGDLIKSEQARPRPKSEPRPEPKLLNLNRETVRRVLTIPSPYFLSRGFSRAVLDEFDVGDSSHPDMKTRAVVPLYDDTGQVCIGYAARSKHPECGRCGWHHYGPKCGNKPPKWKVPAGFPSDRYLFNYARAKASDAPFIFMVEGVPEVLRLAEAGYVGVALLGSEPTEEQVRKLVALDREIWVAFDNDKAGEDAREILWTRKKAAGVRFPTESFYVPDPYKDIGEVPIDTLRQAIADHIAEILDRPF
jgi:hypothetical protein